MSTVIEDFVAKLGWDIDNSKLIAFNRSVNNLDKGLSAVSGKMIRGLNTGFKVATAGAVALGGGIALVAREYSKIEDAEASFTPLLKSAGRAKEMVAALNDTAATTPFQFGQLSDVAGTLLPVMNGNIEKTVSTLRMLGDSAGGNAEKFRGIANGYTKAFLKGKVDMESLNMIGEKGVPIIDELAKMHGKNNKQILKMVSNGKIGLEDLTGVFERMTQKGGIFFNAMDIASKTLTGRLSTLKDETGRAAAEIGGVLAPYLKALTDRLIATAIHVKNWIHQNRELIRTKVTEFIKKIPEYLEKIKYWVPKIAKLVGVFLAITAVVKALNIAMKAVVITKALLGKTGPLQKLSNYLGGTLPTEAGKASKAIKGVGLATGAVAAAFIGWGIGTVIHDEIIDPIMKARHEASMLAQEVGVDMSKDVSKRNSGQLAQDVERMDKYQKNIESDFIYDLPGMGFFRDLQKGTMNMRRNKILKEVTARNNFSRYAPKESNAGGIDWSVGGYQDVSYYAGGGQSRMGGPVDQSMNVAKVENHTHVTGKTVSSEDISKASKKGVEDAFKKIKRNHE